MVDRQSKDFYQQQLAQAAWANLRSSTGMAGYSQSPNTMHPMPGGAMAGHGAATVPPTAANPYENYMQHLQQFAGLAQGSQAANTGMFGGAAAAGAANFLGNGSKEMAPGFTSPFGFPPGHPMHFPGIGNYRPLPAHSPLPAHIKNAPGNSSPTNPLPAHIMRSNPYQQTGAYPGLAPTAPPYSYQMPGGGQQTSYTPVTETSRSRQQFHDQAESAAAVAAQFGSKSAPVSRSVSQDRPSRVPVVPNGVAGGGGSVAASLLSTSSDVSSAYSQLQQLTAAYSQAASAKESNKKQSQPATSNNNCPTYPYAAPTSSQVGGQAGQPVGQPFPPSTNSAIGSDPSYDQIAAALLNRFGGQFSPQLLMEMSNLGQQQSSKGQQPGQLQGIKGQQHGQLQSSKGQQLGPQQSSKGQQLSTHQSSKGQQLSTQQSSKGQQLGPQQSRKGQQLGPLQSSKGQQPSQPQSNQMLGQQLSTKNQQPEQLLGSKAQQLGQSLKSQQIVPQQQGNKGQQIGQPERGKGEQPGLHHSSKVQQLVQLPSSKGQQIGQVPGSKGQQQTFPQVQDFLHQQAKIEPVKQPNKPLPVGSLNTQQDIKVDKCPPDPGPPLTSFKLNGPINPTSRSNVPPSAPVLPSYSNSQPSPSYSHPQPSPGYSNPQPSPSYSNPQPSPSYSNPQPSPSYSNAQPSPSYSNAQPSPSYSNAQPSPSYSAPQPSPSYSAPQPSPSYSAPQPSPSYSAPQPSPSYSAPQQPSPSPFPSQPTTFSPDSQQGPPSVGLNSSGHSTESLSVCSSPVSQPAPAGFLSGVLGQSSPGVGSSSPSSSVGQPPLNPPAVPEVVLPQSPPHPPPDPGDSNEGPGKSSKPSADFVRTPGQPLAHSVASQLPSPVPTPASGFTSSVTSMTNKIKDLQNRVAAPKPQVSSNSTTKKEDTGQLKGLWKMQAEFQKKTIKPKGTPVTGPKPTTIPHSVSDTVGPIRPPSPHSKTESGPVVFSSPGPVSASDQPLVRSPVQRSSGSEFPVSIGPQAEAKTETVGSFTSISQFPATVTSVMPTVPRLPVSAQSPAPPTTIPPQQVPIQPLNEATAMPYTQGLIRQPFEPSIRPPPPPNATTAKPPSPTLPRLPVPASLTPPVPFLSQPPLSPSIRPPVPIKTGTPVLGPTVSPSARSSLPTRPLSPPSVPATNPTPLSAPAPQFPSYQPRHASHGPLGSALKAHQPVPYVPTGPALQASQPAPYIPSGPALPSPSTAPVVFPQFPVPPALLHTPRSPPHPPPPQRPAPPSSYSLPQPVTTPPYSLPLEPSRPNNRVPPPHPMSSQAPFLSYQPPPYLPPQKPPTDQPKLPQVPVEPTQPYTGQNYDRMEVKNSGIPGPGAITWKRKSLEDSPGSGKSKSKKRKLVVHDEDLDDPYSFDEDEGNKKLGMDVREPQANGGPAGMGPLYKKKAAMMLRETETIKTALGSPGPEMVDRMAESDESSRGSGGNISPMKKKNKRPKIEEWSVKKDVKNGGNKDKVQENSDSRPEDSRGAESSNSSNSRKGPLWGLPLVPKPPQKVPTERPRTDKSPEPVVNPSGGGPKSSVSNVWLQAFGAPSVKSKKKPVTEQQQSSSKSSGGGAKKSLPNEEVKEENTGPKTILDIPPEVRRKPRPNFGGLIHFSPDWARSVRRHHERCRIPAGIENSATLKPKILEGGTLSIKTSYEDQARKDMVSPPDLLAMERQRTERSSIATTTSTLATSRPVQSEDELSGQLPSIVETILANRKKLRSSWPTGRMSRMYKERKRKEAVPKLEEYGAEHHLGLLPTPGLPLLTEDTKDVLIGSGFGNFRRYTLLKYLEGLGDTEEGKEWHPEVLETKTRRQSSLTKPVTSIKEIFGQEAPSSKSIRKVGTNNVGAVNDDVSPSSVTKKDKKKKDTKHAAGSSSIEIPVEPVTKVKKFVPKELEAKGPIKLPEVDDGAYSQEVGEPTDDDNVLQTELGGFALDLLDDNASWNKRVTIQNLVIWEPAEQPNVVRKKKGKKKRAKKSGLDFQKRKSKNCSASGSVPVSRAASPLEPDEVHEVSYTLDTVVGESSRWVVDKNAGETILHRASKMGYPDVVAYALDRLGMGSMEKDYAGLTPLHKAAFKGHETNVRVLLKYGADPSSGVKGTRALHEAIEGCSAPTVRTLLSYGADPLLHDYSGNMPLDLASQADPATHVFLGNLLADLHGKTPGKRGHLSPPLRWNVSHAPDFHDPRHHEAGVEMEEDNDVVPDEVVAPKSRLEDMFVFEMSSHPLPPTYQLLDRPGEWVLYKDLKEFAKKRSGTKFDIRSKGDLIELKKSEFIKTSHCALLDRRQLEVRYHERTEEDIVILVKIDKFVRKIFNSEVVHISE